MDEKNIKFSVIFGLKASSNIPQDLKEDTEKYLAEKAEKISAKVRERVAKYFHKSTGSDPRIENIGTRIISETEKYVEDSSESVEDELSHLPESVRKSLSKLKVTDENSERELGEVLENQLSNLASKIVRAKDENEKSLLAFELLQIRINFKIKSFKSNSAGVLDKEQESKLQDLLDDMSLSVEKRNFIMSLRTIKENLLNRANEGIEEIQKLQVLSLEEYKEQDLDTRYNYIKNLGEGINSIEKELLEVLDNSKRELALSLMSKNSSDRFLLVALGK